MIVYLVMGFLEKIIIKVIGTLDLVTSAQELIRPVFAG